MLLTLTYTPVACFADGVEPVEYEQDDGWALFGMSKLGNYEQLLGIYDDYQLGAEAIESLFWAMCACLSTQTVQSPSATHWPKMCHTPCIHSTKSF